MLNEGKNLKTVLENNLKKFVQYIDVVERAFLILKKVGLSSETNIVIMMSQIEKLIAIALGIKYSIKQFEGLLEYLLRENKEVEADVRIAVSNSKASIHNAVIEEGEPEGLVNRI